MFVIGGAFSYNIGSKIKNKYSVDNTEYKTSIKGSYNVAPYKIPLGARLSYKGFGLYVNYGLTKMNDNQLETQAGVSNLMPFSAGITLGL